MTFIKIKHSFWARWCSRLLIGPIIFFLSFPLPLVRAQMVPEINLPPVGTMLPLTEPYAPVMIKGMTIHPEDPFLFDFIVHPGETQFPQERLSEEAKKLIKYFLAALTVPEEEMWVNLSPYESHRIIPNRFGATEMGRDLLAQDYLLKQLMASLMYPEDELGSNFWNRVYAEAYAKYGTTDIPLDTFNKVWIVPERAVIHENGMNVFVMDTHLKVLTEKDYMATQAARSKTQDEKNIFKKESSGVSHLTSDVVKNIIIPALEREVNEGKTFANLRQISNAVILATWYKENVVGSYLKDVYVNQKKVEGIETKDKKVNQKIYQQYIQAFKKGVYDYIKEEYDPGHQEIIPRRYFSGGVKQDWTLESADDDFAISTKEFEGSQDFQVRLADIKKSNPHFNVKNAMPSIVLSVEDIQSFSDLSQSEGLIKFWELLAPVLEVLDLKASQVFLGDENLNFEDSRRLAIERYGNKRLVSSVWEHVFIHAVENAIDGFVQALENGTIDSDEKLSIDFDIHEEGENIFLDVINNGVSLEDAENSKGKKEMRVQGKKRIGGKNLGLKRMAEKAALIHPDAKVSLLDRRGQRKDKEGVIQRVAFPKQNPFNFSLEKVRTSIQVGLPQYNLAEKTPWKPMPEFGHKIAMNPTGQIKYCARTPMITVEDDGFDFYWTRHGQTYGNRFEFGREQINKLTEKGILDSQEAADKLFKQILPDLKEGAKIIILTSSKERNRFAADYFQNLIYEKTGMRIKVEEHKFLDEKGLGRFEEVSPVKLVKQSPEAKRYWENFYKELNARVKPPLAQNPQISSESFLDLLARVKKGLEGLKQRVHEERLRSPGQKIIVTAFVHNLQSSAMRVALGDRSMLNKGNGFVNWRRNSLANATPKYFDWKKRELVSIEDFSGSSRKTVDEDYAMAIDTVRYAEDSLSGFPSLEVIQEKLDEIDYKREEVYMQGFETEVIRRQKLGFVLKIYKASEEAEEETRKNYQLAVDRLGPKGLIAQTLMDVDVVINYQGQKVDLPKIIIQEETVPLNEAIQAFMRQGKEDVVKYLIKQKIELDKKILNEGLYVHDNFFKNCGVTKDGRVVLIDLGNVIEDINASHELAYDLLYKRDQPLGAEHRLNKRGRVLYHPIFMFRELDDKDLGERLEKYYRKVIGLNFLELSDEFTPEDINLFKEGIERDLKILKPEDIYFLPEEVAPLEQKDMIYEYVLRNKYAEEFIAIAEEEYARDYGKNQDDFAQATHVKDSFYEKVVGQIKENTDYHDEDVKAFVDGIVEDPSFKERMDEGFFVNGYAPKNGSVLAGTFANTFLEPSGYYYKEAKSEFANWHVLMDGLRLIQLERLGFIGVIPLIVEAAFDPQETFWYHARGINNGANLYSEAFSNLPLLSQVDIVRRSLVNLKEVHREGVAMNDFQGDNILFNTEKVNQVQVIDFGVADEEGVFLSSVTQEFTAPEWESSFKNDIYSIGMLAWQAFVGQFPTKEQFREEKFIGIDLFEKINVNQVPSVFLQNGFVDFIRQMIQTDPEDRPSLDQVIERFEQLEDDLIDAEGFNELEIDERYTGVMYYKRMRDFNRAQGKYKVVEFGPRDYRFASEYKDRHPEHLFLGLEKEFNEDISFYEVAEMEGLIEQDARMTCLDDSSVDKVVINMPEMEDFKSNLKEMLVEAKRILKPDGKIEIVREVPLGEDNFKTTLLKSFKELGFSIDIAGEPLRTIDPEYIETSYIWKYEKIFGVNFYSATKKESVLSEDFSMAVEHRNPTKEELKAYYQDVLMWDSQYQQNVTEMDLHVDVVTEIYEKGLLSMNKKNLSRKWLNAIVTLRKENSRLDFYLNTNKSALQNFVNTEVRREAHMRQLSKFHRKEEKRTIDAAMTVSQEVTEAFKNFASKNIASIFSDVREVFNEELITKKDNGTPKTITDELLQIATILKLHELFPEDGFVGEEDLTDQDIEVLLGHLKEYPKLQEKYQPLVERYLHLLGQGALGNKVGVQGYPSRIWISDPLDGTRTFSLGGDKYSWSTYRLTWDEDKQGYVPDYSIIFRPQGKIEFGGKEVTAPLVVSDLGAKRVSVFEVKEDGSQEFKFDLKPITSEQQKWKNLPMNIRVSRSFPNLYNKIFDELIGAEGSVNIWGPAVTGSLEVLLGHFSLFHNPEASLWDFSAMPALRILGGSVIRGKTGEKVEVVTKEDIDNARNKIRAFFILTNGGEVAEVSQQIVKEYILPQQWLKEAGVPSELTDDIEWIKDVVTPLFKQFKIIITDLDDSIVNGKSPEGVPALPQEAAQTIDRIRSQEIQLSAVTGKPAGKIPFNFSDQLSAASRANQYLATENGARIYRFDAQGNLDENSPVRTIAFPNDPSLIKQVKSVMQEVWDEVIKSYPDVNPEMPFQRIEDGEGNVLDLKILNPDDPQEFRAELGRRMRERFQAETRTQAVKALESSIAVNVTYADKGDAVRYILAELGIDQEDVLILGDSTLDDPMYKALPEATRIYLGETPYPGMDEGVITFPAAGHIGGGVVLKLVNLFAQGEDHAVTADLKDVVEEKIEELLANKGFIVKTRLMSRKVDLDKAKLFAVKFSLGEILQNVAEHVQISGSDKNVTVRMDQNDSSLIISMRNPGAIKYQRIRARIFDEIANSGSLLYTDEFGNYTLVKNEILEMFDGEQSMLNEHLKKILKGEKIVPLSEDDVSSLSEDSLPFINGLGELGVGLYVARRKIRDEFQGDISLVSDQGKDETIAKIVLALDSLRVKKGEIQSISEDIALAVKRKGGIDLNPRNIDIQMNKKDSKIYFLPHELTFSSQSITGFKPVILQVQPISNISQLLGI